MQYPDYFPQSGWRTKNNWDVPVTQRENPAKDHHRILRHWGRIETDHGLITIEDLDPQDDDAYSDLVQDLDLIQLCKLNPYNDVFQSLVKYLDNTVPTALPLDLSFARNGRVLVDRRGAKVIVTKIYAVKNPALWQAYYNVRHEARRDRIAKGLASGSAPEDPLGGVHFVVKQSGGDGLQFPVADSSIGECYLLHCAPKDACKSILQGGFVPDWGGQSRTASKGRIGQKSYGRLGQGVYLSDDFGKNLQYSQCPKCGSSGKKRCKCSPTPKPGRLPHPGSIPRPVIVCRALLNQMACTRSMRKFAKRSVDDGDSKDSVHAQGKAGRHRLNPLNYRNNEFLVRDKTQLYPEFLIYFALL